MDHGHDPRYADVEGQFVKLAAGLHALANRYLGTAYVAQSDYRRGIDCLKPTVVFLPGTQRHECFGQAALPAVQARAQLAGWHAELGLFPEGSVLGDEGLRMAEVMAHPVSLMHALWGLGMVALRQGDPPRAIPRLERTMAMTFWLPQAEAALVQVGSEGVDVLLLLHLIILAEAYERRRQAEAGLRN